LPFGPGMEGAGIIEKAGSATALTPGTRVAWTQHPGAYAQFAAVPAWKVVTLPEGVDDQSGAAALLQGMTAEYLCETTYPARVGDLALVHAGAGGVGLLLIQLLKQKGARVFTTVSTPEKAVLAQEAGADETIVYTETDFVEAVKKFTHGKGVHVAYDSVGKTTYEGSLNVLRPLGMLVLFGQSSGPVPPIDPLLLSQKGSLFLTRPSLAHRRCRQLQSPGDQGAKLGRAKITETADRKGLPARRSRAGTAGFGSEKNNRQTRCEDKLKHRNLASTELTREEFARRETGGFEKIA
jgi:NADPH:quinone reductase